MKHFLKCKLFSVVHVHVHPACSCTAFPCFRVWVFATDLPIQVLCIWAIVDCNINFDNNVQPPKTE